MIGVKAPLKRGAPRPEKSAKKTKPKPDDNEHWPQQDVETANTSEDLVIKNPYVQYELPIPQNYDQLIPTSIPPIPPSPTPQDEDEMHIERVIKKVRQCSDENEQVEPLPQVLEKHKTLPRVMKIRYEELLEKVHPRELKDGETPHLTWLEQHYGHLVSKSFWYDRFVKLAAMYREICPNSDDVWEKEREDLEKVVGHLVPLTEAEKEYQQLYKYYQRDNVKIDGPVSLEFLRGRYTCDAGNQEAYEAGDEDDGVDSQSDDDRYVLEACPIHEDELMKCLNPGDDFRCAFFKCSRRECPVFYTDDTKTAVLHQINHAIHPIIRDQLLEGSLKCHCDFTPNMKLSKSQKNFNRVFLTCFKKEDPCTYFQFIHWKPRPREGPMDGFVQKLPRSEAMECIPSEVHRQQKQQGFFVTKQQPKPWRTQQMVATGLDRFKKDQVKTLPRKPIRSHPTRLFYTRPTVIKPSGVTTHGFVPDPNYRPPFVRGIHLTEADIANKRYGPTGSCLF